MTVHGVGVLDPLNDWPNIRHIRLWDCGTTWADLNPAEGVFHWDRLDAIVEQHPKARLLLVLAVTPTWAATDPTSVGAPWLPVGSNSQPKRIRDWEAYVRAVVARYAGRIHAYQVWNEPQLREFWSPYGSVGVLASMTARAATIIRRIDPDAKIVSAPVLPRASSGGMRRAEAYLHALAHVGWPVDAHAAHIYPEIGKGATAWGAAVMQWRAGLARARAPRKPLWVTETNMNLMGGPLPVDEQTRLVRVTDRIADEQNIARVYWYAYGRHGDPRVYGIPFTAGSPGMTALEAL